MNVYYFRNRFQYNFYIKGKNSFKHGFKRTSRKFLSHWQNFSKQHKEQLKGIQAQAHL